MAQAASLSESGVKSQGSSRSSFLAVVIVDARKNVGEPSLGVDIVEARRWSDKSDRRRANRRTGGVIILNGRSSRT